MREKDPNLEGYVITLNSFASQRDVPPVKSMHFYTASKYAVKAIVQGLRTELKELGSPIRISQINPQRVATPMSLEALGEEAYKHVAPLVMQPEDIADAVVYILSTPTFMQVNDLTIANMKEPPRW